MQFLFMETSDKREMGSLKQGLSRSNVEVDVPMMMMMMMMMMVEEKKREKYICGVVVMIE